MQGRHQRWADPEVANKRQRIVVSLSLSLSPAPPESRGGTSSDLISAPALSEVPVGFPGLLGSLAGQYKYGNYARNH